MRFGANLQPTFDADIVSHIIVGDHVKLGVLLSKIGLKSYQEIPDRIPTLLWNWVAPGVTRAKKGANSDKVIKLPEYWKVSAYPQRFEAGEVKRDSDNRTGKKPLRKSTSHKLYVEPSTNFLPPYIAVH